MELRENEEIIGSILRTYEICNMKYLGKRVGLRLRLKDGGWRTKLSQSA